MSPFIEYLYLKPLYSKRGGSTTRAEALTKNPVPVTLRWNPLYKWKILAHLIFVLSVKKTQDSLYNIYNLFFGFDSRPHRRGRVLLRSKILLTNEKSRVCFLKQVHVKNLCII